MNAELLRNVWLELAPRRMLQMGVVLALILLAANAPASGGAAIAAEYLFYGLVVLWGTRDAAQSVVGEIRERTWDFQRLSALTPFEMTWGKLLGATSYVWFGGAICLAVLIAFQLRNGVPNVWQGLFHYVALGLLAQAAALFASLIAIRRRQTRTRFNVFQYQAAGVIASLVAWQAWRTFNPYDGSAGFLPNVMWWGMNFEGQAFYLVSLGVFLAWTLVGCWRLMRLELQVQNYPVVWLAFILFMAGYVAGFADLSVFPLVQSFLGPSPLRLAVASLVFVFLTYVAILYEPKDRVLYRWLGEMVAKGRTGAALSRLQCWMVSYAAAMIASIALVLQLSAPGTPQTILSVPLVVAAMGFLTRDLGIVLFFGLAPEQKRGDMPAVITLAVLYLVLPILFARAGSVEPAMLLYPTPGGDWMGAVVAWVQAVAVWFFVVNIRGKQTAALPET